MRHYPYLIKAGNKYNLYDVEIRRSATLQLLAQKKHVIWYMIALWFFMLPNESYTQQNRSRYASDKTAHAIKISNAEITPDGALTENIWNKAEYTTGFTQRFPDEGEPAEDSTFVGFLYDEEYLYIGARMYSSDKIVRTVSRRDESDNSERIIVSMDTFNDNRTAYTFSVTASGVRVEYFHPSDRNFDREYSYDPVWEADAKITPFGWTAEMKIPLSQLRFNEDQATWGLNINRWIPVRNEDDFWVHIPRDATGWSSRFGRLVGIEKIESERPIELIPFAATNADLKSEVNSQNPFDEKFENDINAGGNVKVGIGPNFTLDGTVNPDFGQVDADPAVVNLSAFEIAFPERRPFFIEGSQLLESSGATFFRSRRIGTQPRGRVDADFVDRPDNTTILGATKLTGRTPDGWSVGVLTSLTAKETASTFTQTNIGEQFDGSVVEPLTGYEVARVQKEFGESASTAGLMMTGVQRDLDAGSNLADQFTKQAYSGNADWNIRLQGGKYELSGNVGFSHVTGTEDVIQRLQESSARFFQRPNANYVNYDTTRTSLTGYNANLEFEKNAGEHWLWEVEFGAESPEFEINDIGLITTVDDLRTEGSLTYRENEPGKLFRDYRFSVFANSRFNYGGLRTNTLTSFSWDFTFHNFWEFNGNVFQDYPAFSDNLTRGGPVAAKPFRWGGNMRIRTNRSENTSASVRLSWATNELNGWNYSINTGITARPGGRWRINLDPRYRRSKDMRQYITTLNEGPDITFGKRFIFAAIDRSTISLQSRVNYSLTPDLSIELYAEPFVSTGNFSNFGQLPEPRALELQRFGQDNSTTISKTEDGYRVVDGNDSFTFRTSDFNVLSFRSNLVMRWQWRPGSTLFLVWSQDRSERMRTGSLASPSDLFDSITTDGLNNFAFKITYWLPVDINI